MHARSSKVFNVVKCSNDQGNLAVLQRLLQAFHGEELTSNDAVAGALSAEDLLQYQLFSELGKPLQKLKTEFKLRGVLEELSNKTAEELYAPLRDKANQPVQCCNHSR